MSDERPEFDGPAPERPMEFKRRPSGAPELPDVLREGPSPRKVKPPSAMTPLAKGLALGWDLVGSIAAGLVIGVLLDRWLGTSPVFVLVGLGVGLLGSTWRLLRQASLDAGRGSNGGGRRSQNH